MSLLPDGYCPSNECLVDRICHECHLDIQIKLRFETDKRRRKSAPKYESNRFQFL